MGPAERAQAIKSVNESTKNAYAVHCYKQL